MLHLQDQGKAYSAITLMSNQRIHLHYKNCLCRGCFNLFIFFIFIFIYLFFFLIALG